MSSCLGQVAHDRYRQAQARRRSGCVQNTVGLFFTIVFWLSIGFAVKAQGQESLLPPDRQEIADDDHSWSVSKIPPQKYMKEIYWDDRSREMPAFFRDSLVQY